MDIQQALYPNLTLFLQAILFLIFVALVSKLLVKPYSQVIEEREALTKKNMEEALKLKEEAQRYLEEARVILEKGGRESGQILEQAKREGERIRSELLLRVERETQEEIEKSVEEIRKSLEEEKRKLEERVRELAELIKQRVLEEAA
ncbi:MAG: ATP synthase F0 subunit B [Aquificaceae bacterium]|nr:ATP synthase F0 subunit B [Aquificaceae bacterium]MCS7196657.1 ATP synthase F0 subunit B [Aquificaceae bacterium]MCX7990012.1 ATP synthase F0 subunit B [Aquificaceae bacterium]MDW8032904.1 ATP synthase F0 subunit B [Aquificaceae bacterium]MDW8294719.1 ATP synthase F0 subunit B [Aquificaceae bacterium]